LVGRDAAVAARSVLPAALERGLEVEPDGVRVPVPIVHHGWHGPVKVAARASLEAVE
jgi:hypothetical protein